MNSRPAVVITSIFKPNAVMEEIARQCSSRRWSFLIAGDSVSPADFCLTGADFLSLDSQRRMGRYGSICPERTYARKNLAYLEAIRRHAPFIVETDDDNMPRADFWSDHHREQAGRWLEHDGWVNAYRFFSDHFIYPRGYPIDQALGDWNVPPEPQTLPAGSTRTCPIQQFLADENPDVDAVYRMLYPLPLNFRQGSPLILGPGSWCPFNSQNTVFFPEVYPLLYLPATCSFRMTDIWRSFIAQRILWTCGWHLSFHSATVYQERNEHRLIKDFEDEIPGYLGNARLVSILGGLDLKSGPEHLRANLEHCYQVLIREGFFKPVEAELLAAWLHDLA